MSEYLELSTGTHLQPRVLNRLEDRALGEGSSQASNTSRKRVWIPNSLPDVPKEQQQYANGSKHVEEKPEVSSVKSRRCMRSGVQYQATIPDLLPKNDEHVQVNDDPGRSQLIWRPSGLLPHHEVEKYVTDAQARSYSVPQALGLLYCNNYNIIQATEDLKKYIPSRSSIDKWSNADINLFERSLKLYGKNFPKIQLVLPHKSLPAIIQFYYKWKMVYFKNSKHRQSTDQRSGAPVVATLMPPQHMNPKRPSLAQLPKQEKQKRRTQNAVWNLNVHVKSQLKNKTTLGENGNGNTSIFNTCGVGADDADVIVIE